ncbi:LOW QUALITY PROTEIN: leukocyte immunoglobulin-like receptor subfamily B member 2 [Salvelinus fontinalis]|uniref:LOW QUALITY PROTEIN: leukocyte immunoglobulin-like receptor subfamily B member 2 n=1 Tax=Salvelinus fontinalis TaxID=8038 RepID=UPI002485B76E|nr:LOW QUALITY PROTEIN: leukocyte immunoglobulin-like receptor subfamily B member 2 [Salvelinus fontinalis]
MHQTRFLIPTDSRLTATLSSDKEDVFTGDSVTLSRTVESSGWKFYWYRHRTDSTPVVLIKMAYFPKPAFWSEDPSLLTSSEDEESVTRYNTSNHNLGYSYTLSWVSVSDGGQYWCRAGRGDPVYYTLYSDPVQLNITVYSVSCLCCVCAERPVAVLTLQPNWTQIFIRETVTMRCDIQGGGDSDWNYRWYKNRQLLLTLNTKPEYRISPVYWSNSGSYTCVGVKGNKISKTSDVVQLTVSDQPQPVLSISPQWLNPGDSVTLSCEVDKMSTGWRFSWYRTVPYRAGLPSLSDKSYSLQPLSDNGTSEDSYTLIPAGPTPTGGYVCRAGRGDPVYDTLYSEPQFLWSGALPVASVSVSPQGVLYSGETVSLQCVIPDYTDWMYLCFRDNHHLPSQTSKAIDNTIPITLTGQAGQYRCEGKRMRRDRTQRSQPSDDITISVTALPKATLTVEPNPVFPGETVTLMCSVGSDSIWNYQWYKDRNDNVVSQSGYSNIGVSHTISRADVSDQGQYWCEGNRVSRPTSSQPSGPVTHCKR